MENPTDNHTIELPDEKSQPVEKSWEERISTFVDAISRPTTKAGELLTTLLDTFFPDGITSYHNPPSSDSNVSDIFTQLITLCDVKALAEHGVISKALMASQLHKIHQNLQAYCKGSTRSVFMKSLVELCGEFFNLMIDFSRQDVVQLMPVMEIFGSTGGGWKSPYAQDLSKQVREYETYFTDIYPRWKDWRKSKILISTFDDPQDPKTFIQQVSDTLMANSNTNYESIRYFSPEDVTQLEAVSDNKTSITNACINSKLRLFNEVNAEFMKLYVYTFALHKFAPDNWSAPTMAPSAKVSTITYGPYGRDTFPNGSHGLDDCGSGSTLCDDEPGVIIGININAGDGNPREGELFTIRGLNEGYNHIIAVDLYYYPRVMCGVEFFFSHGTSTGIMGKRHEKAEVIKCGPIGNGEFKLTGVRMADVTREQSGKAISHMELKFEHIRVASDDG
ncbi:15563_t:CDS:2 [Acaulospora colombiana]|uniref:15563_t:CDS:1 n=1 Tax=Acaulospora colombiana TaxID=27376 RepID=A0ACA9K2L1_9GLOM|nr:15563_t:CDS:2 [Acaulospora colombiana]